MADDLGTATNALDRLLADTARTLESMRALPTPADAPGPLRGTGSGADGRIQATVAAANRIESLTFDPRVIRIASEDIAAEVVVAVNAAFADFERQAQAGAGAVGDPVQVADRLRELREESARSMASVTEALNSVLGQIRQGRW